MHFYDLVDVDRFAAALPLLGGIFAKASAILLLGGLCALLARGASAASRHMIWTLTLGGALAVPLVSAVVPRWRIPIDLALAPWVQSAPAAVATTEPAIAVRAFSAAPSVAIYATPRESEVASPTAVVVSGEPAATATTTSIYSRTVTASSDVQLSAPIASASRASFVWTAFAPWLVVIWAVGVMIALAPTALGFARLAVITRRARPMRGGRWALLIPSAMRELDVRRHVRFVELDGPVMPMTWGVFRPVVLLPADDFNSTIEQRLDVLRHELAHVRRYDCLTQLIGQVACAFHWFNPLAWLVARELRVERERACDDEVLRAGAKASDYADYLLNVARQTHIVGAAALGGLAMARPSQMAGRLLAVLDDRRCRERVSGSATMRAVLIASAVVGAVASAAPVAASAGDIVPVIALVQGSVTSTSDDGIRVGPLEISATAPAAASTVPLATTLAATSIAPRVANPPLAVSQMGAPTAPCDRKTGGEHSHSNWTSSENGAKRWRVIWNEGDCSYEIEARGDVKYNQDVTDIESISSGGMFTIDQHIGDDTKRLVVRPRDDGTLERTYSVNGARQEYDAAARAWFAEALVALDRQTAFAVDQRVPAILQRGGVDAVLQEITLLGSDYARRRYYTKLLAMRQLDRGQVKRVVEQAGASMSSDYELAELLVALSKLEAFGDDSHTAFVAAAKKINSDYERRRALNALLQRDRLAPQTVQSLLDAAGTIGSDYELAELLIDVSKRYAINDQTRPAYIKALGSIKSDYEHRRVLSTIVAGGGLTPAVNRTLLEDAVRIGSDYELAEFLIQMGKAGALDASTRDAYFAAADKIDSDYEHHRALTPLLKRELLTKDLAKAILASAAKIDSDYECAQLLVEVASAITIDDDLRPAYEKAANTIEGEYEYGRAMSAVRRRVTR